MSDLVVDVKSCPTHGLQHINRRRDICAVPVSFYCENHGETKKIIKWFDGKLLCLACLREVKVIGICGEELE